LRLTCQTPLLKSSAPAKRHWQSPIYICSGDLLERCKICSGIWQAKLLGVLTNAGTLAYFLINFMELKISEVVLKYTKLHKIPKMLPFPNLLLFDNTVSKRVVSF